MQQVFVFWGSFCLFVFFQNFNKILNIKMLIKFKDNFGSSNVNTKLIVSII